MLAVETVPLTSLARAGGCAAKYAAGRLETLLAGLVPADSDDLLVGLDPADDAAVYRLDDERAIVFTVDFFPPLVDDPRTFGAIAATNALNDVFAMGGAPLLALSVAAFPEELPVEVLGEVLAGADERVRAAGAILAGGHTIRDDEPKYGLAVVGMVHPERIWPKAGARAGDVLLLTKRLGTGIVLQAQRDGIAPADALDAAVESMVELNMAAADVLRPFEPSAVTDVTGFGLLGHTHELATRSGVRAILDAGALPSLPSALELAAGGVRTGGTAVIGTSWARTSRAMPTQQSRRSPSTRRRLAASSYRFRASVRPSSRRHSLPRGSSLRASGWSRKAKESYCVSAPSAECTPASRGCKHFACRRPQSATYLLVCGLPAS